MNTMNNPFPGMDPWLERHWGDVHQALVTYARDELQERLPDGLLARMQDRVMVESLDGGSRAVYPDVRVIEQRRAGVPVDVSPASGPALAEPLILHLQGEPAIESIVEIIEIGSHARVITVLEVLSPANKSPGAGSEMYLQKQRELADARVSLVEIDLLRSGRRVLNATPAMLPPEYRTTYQACVRRGYQRDSAEIYRIALRERLPVIRVPLRKGEPDVALDLQVLVDQAYRKGRYGMSIDYRGDPEPPLENDDAAWADELLRSKGLR